MRSYVGEADGAVPLHRFLDYIQSGVVPAGQLEAQGPVGGDDGVADELKTQWRRGRGGRWSSLAPVEHILGEMIFFLFVCLFGALP